MDELTVAEQHELAVDLIRSSRVSSRSQIRLWIEVHGHRRTGQVVTVAEADIDAVEKLLYRARIAVSWEPCSHCKGKPPHGYVCARCGASA